MIENDKLLKRITNNYLKMMNNLFEKQIKYRKENSRFNVFFVKL